MHDLAPDYLKKLIIAKCQLRPGLRSNGLVYDLEVPFVKHKTFGDRTFSVVGPCLWNGLPSDLKLITDYSLFNSKLKTYLFIKF